MIYDVIFLAIYSETNHGCYEDTYKNMKLIGEKYYDKFSNIKFFYIQMKEDIEDEVVENGNMLYVRGKEVFDKIYYKTIKAYEYIYANYEYKFIVRTNVSSFWNIPKTVEFFNNSFDCKNDIPDIDVAFGWMFMYENPPLISGTSICFTKKTTKHYLGQGDRSDQYNHPDDIVICKILYENNVNIISDLIELNRECCPLQDFVYDEERINNSYIYYRVKNPVENNNRDMDIKYFQKIYTYLTNGEPC